ncbi:DUF6894 family protein [Bradyrhizobium stylosanthis]|uniref:DUF6894 family protein n=1 Tax=Bradyrhizobium stylosanthis TaxID=1803665 RepID=UPI0007C5C559
MPRYFFNVYSDDDSVEDLRDDEAAWHQATIFAGEVLRDVDGRFRPGQQWSLGVTDQTRKPIFYINVGSRKMK